MANKKQYEMSFELNGKIDPRLTRSFDDLNRDVTGLDKDLNQLKHSKGLDKVARDAEDAQGAFRELRENAKELTKVFEKTLQFTGAHKIITTVGDMFGNMISEVGALDDSVHQMGAATGATVEQMAEFKDIAKDIYEVNLGEGFNDIANALVNVQRTTKQSGDELERTTKNALILRDTFGYDVNESVRSADMLMRQFGLTSEQAYNLIAQGSQKGLDRTGELLDSINEFTPQFKTLGFTADEMFDFFATGLDAGAWNLDKVADMVKEFDNRIKDAGDANAQDALAQLFAPPDIDEFAKALSKGSKATKEYQELVARSDKSTAATLVKNLKAGGKKGADSMLALASILGDSQKVLDGLSSGSMRGADALNMILGKLAAIEDPIEKQTMGIAIMGTQYEDLGQQVMDSLSTVNSQFDKTTNTMQQIEEVRYSSVTKDIQKLGRELMESVVIPIGEELLPVLQNLTAWATENKDVIKTLALGVPAGMLAKNTASMGKDLVKVSKTFLGTAGNVGKFGGALGLLGGPIGWTVLGVGALTTGVIAYKKHQEKARQELINMGDALDKAYEDYSGVETQTRKTKELITEYDRLTTKIKNTKTPADELTEARRKLAIVEQDLIDLNPDILRAEDAKSDSFREQLGLADQLNSSRSEMQRREMEMSVFEAQQNLPTLLEEYDELNKKLAESDAAYLEAQRSYAQYAEYLNKHHEIVNNQALSYDEVNQKLSELAQQIYQDTGLDYSGNFANMQYDAEQAKKAIDSNFESWKKAQEEISKSEQSFQSYYDNQKKLIELDLGGTLSDYAAKYAELSEAEKQQFKSAMQNLSELNREMDMIPDAKKVNVELVWQQTGQIPDFSTPAGKALKQIQLRDPGFNGYASGGYVDSPELAWVGEGRSPEWIIPENNSRRSHALYAAAGEALGYNRGGSFAPVFNPIYQIQGNADEKVIRQVVSESQRDFELKMKRYYEQQKRVNF
ncbi:hypothetical protein J41TS12_39370 [Paenibacillus antibioticophila]|uniref:Phage tail tape measure protein domain-containing protein n=1 Tax=Paenibacillus antibioticophila TaxID=1274374 RepID=A0A919XV92_9BACL|nr:phage tail tape measure protein [Paenibacillus antibioticophila]GIO39076.1 hypothetical protein J41TS12_39370 [Paenibacillus antibioticophila]